MLFGFAAPERMKARAPTASAPEDAFYSDSLLPALQSTLASLADLDIRHEIERDYLEEWSGPDEVKRRLIDALEAGWQRHRKQIVQRLTRFQAQIRAHSGQP